MKISPVQVSDMLVMGLIVCIPTGIRIVQSNDLFKEGSPSKEEKDWLPTIIENNVSIGSGSTILPVKITEGCVIGAGSVVTKNLEVKGIYAGNPAKLIRKL